MKQWKICELWFSEKENSHTFFVEDNLSVKASLPPDAVLVWTCRAQSWKDAMQQKHIYLGFEPYKAEDWQPDDWG